MGVLNGIRVLDFGRFIAGPYCAALLGDLGADVIRVEKREGSEDRTLIPLSFDAEGRPREGAMFVQMNRNKRGMTLDPMTPQGRAIAARLIERADVVVANLPAPTLKDMGLDFATIAAINPRTILTTVSAFGSEGPYAARVGFDGVAQAMCGAAYLSGTPEQPMRSAAAWVDFGTASLSAFGTLAALMAREQTGHGQVVEGALLGTALTYFSTMLIEQAGRRTDRVATLNRGQTAGPSDMHRTKDGWILIAVNGDPLFRRWAKMIGEPHWLSDPRFANDQTRGDNGALISARMDRWCAERTSADALAALEAARIPAGPVLAPQQVLDDPHVRAAGFFTPAAYPDAPMSALIARTPVKLSETPGEVRLRPPLLGEHTDAILAEHGYSADEIARFRCDGVI